MKPISIPHCSVRLALRYGAPGLLLAASLAQAATTITMGSGSPVNNTAVNDNLTFGDNIPAIPPNANFTTSAGAAGVVGTPDISLTFGGGGKWDHYNAWDNRGSVLQGEPGAVPLTISLTPTAGWAASFVSVDLDMWSGGGPMSADWSVTGTISGTLASGTWSRTTGGRDLINFGNSVGAIGEVLTFNLNLTSGIGTYFAIDNLTFDQVPEPSAALLGGLALGAAAMRRRRF